MCRLLLMRSDEPFDAAPVLERFAGVCRSSDEYQGHGWGVVWLGSGRRRRYRSLVPIWEDDLGRFGTTSFLLAHARSAFGDRDIAVENNMPFVDRRYCFAFNGELNGVRIREQGRIGAHKLFNYLRGRLRQAEVGQAFRRAVQVICRRSARVRAMNMVITDMNRVLLCSHFDERPEYFTLHMRRRPGLLAICSEPLPEEAGWQPVANHTVAVLA